MTQTTQERIATLINEGIDGDSGGALVGHLVVARIIAAEIDALAAQLAAQDAALVDMPKLAALLATAEAERDEARTQIAGYEAGMRFQFDRAEDYKAQRDEARAEVERLRLPAEAWEAYEVYQVTFSKAKRDIFADAAARAREARK